MGICASNIRTAALEPASTSDEIDQPKKTTGKLLRSGSNKNSKSGSVRSDKKTGDKGRPRVSIDVSRGKESATSDLAKKPNVGSPNGDFKISFSEQGDKYLNVQKWLNECFMDVNSINPILPINGVMVHNMPDVATPNDDSEKNR